MNDVSHVRARYFSSRQFVKRILLSVLKNGCLHVYERSQDIGTLQMRKSDQSFDYPKAEPVGECQCLLPDLGTQSPIAEA